MYTYKIYIDTCFLNVYKEVKYTIYSKLSSSSKRKLWFSVLVSRKIVAFRYCFNLDFFLVSGSYLGDV